jgi:hypothetical protein
MSQTAGLEVSQREQASTTSILRESTSGWIGPVLAIAALLLVALLMVQESGLAPAERAHLFDSFSAYP